MRFGSWVIVVAALALGLGLTEPLRAATPSGAEPATATLTEPPAGAIVATETASVGWALGAELARQPVSAAFLRGRDVRGWAPTRFAWVGSARARGGAPRWRARWRGPGQLKVATRGEDPFVADPGAR